MCKIKEIFMLLIHENNKKKSRHHHLLLQSNTLSLVILETCALAINYSVFFLHACLPLLRKPSFFS